MFRVALLVVALLGLNIGTSFSAAATETDCYTGDNAKLTNPEHWNVGYRACTQLIESKTGKARATAYSARSAWLRRLKQYDEALADTRRAIAIDPANVEFYDAQADIHLDNGNLDGASDSYERAIRTDRNYAPAYVGRGDVARRKGDLERARASYNAALATTPTRVNDTTGLQQWAHRAAADRLKALDEKK